MSPIACHCSQGKKLSAVKHSASWIIPGVMLAVVPKCPLCLAAWLSLAFGIGISASTATVLHTTVTILCIFTCTLFLIRHLRLPRNT